MSVSDLTTVEAAWAAREIERLRQEVERQMAVSAERAMNLDLLRECADLLREDIEGCLTCNYGHGATGVSSEGEACEGCADQRDLLRRIEAVI